MAPPSKEQDVRQAVAEFLRINRQLDPTEHPINVKAVSKAIGVSRGTLYKYGLDQEIHRAQEEQKTISASNPTAQVRHRDKLKIQELKDEVELWKQRCLAQAAELAIMDENAQSHGIDPEELRRLPPKPDRTISHASRRKRSIYNRSF